MNTPIYRAVVDKPPPFDPKAKCRKCGFTQTVARYCGSRPKDAVSCLLEREHLHRQCLRCSFIWEESCLDTPVIEELERMLKGGRR